MAHNTAATVYFAKTAYDMTVQTISTIVDEAGCPIDGDAITKFGSKTPHVLVGGLWGIEADRDAKANTPQFSFPY